MRRIRWVPSGWAGVLRVVGNFESRVGAVVGLARRADGLGRYGVSGLRFGSRDAPDSRATLTNTSIDDINSPVQYVGNWTNEDGDFFGGTATYCQGPGNGILLNFSGERLSWPLPIMAQTSS